MNKHERGRIASPVRMVEKLGLGIIVLATIAAGALEIQSMWQLRMVGVSDLLLLFMYLELISMAEIYWRMGRLPVRMPLYIAMVGIARHLMTEQTNASSWDMLAGAGAIVLLGLAVLVVRYGHLRFPYERTQDGDPEH